MLVKYFIAILFVFLVFDIRAQHHLLTLEHSIELAQEQSLDAFRARYMFRVKQLDYKDFQTYLLPNVSLNLTPVSYNRSIVEVYNSTTKRYESVEVQRLNSNYSVGIDQKLGFTNGSLSISSNLSRNEQYGNNSYLNYVSTPLSIGYSQQLFGVNNYRWRSKIEPLKFAQAQLVFIESQEKIALQTIQLFFNVLSAQTNLHIAELNQVNADSLLAIGEKRQLLGSISRDDLLNLKLKQVNAAIALDQNRNKLKDTKRDFCEFLEIPYNPNITCDIPNSVLLDFISPDLAQKKAQQNNPQIQDLERKLLEVEQQLVQAKKSRFRMNMNLGFGFNQNKSKLNDAFSDLLNRQNANVSLSIPLLDWKTNRRNITRAQIRKELVEKENEKSNRQVEIMISKNTDAFNLRQKEVQTAAIADTIAQSAYEATQQRFVLGKVNVIDINEAYKALYAAKNGYINALLKYWTAYYTMRKLCLYDFRDQKDLKLSITHKLEID
ncbi:TolC family protein [Prolixibacteraceae bacterium JC049]|nr:TolC family protein [Prolixibacteraceae bacterium JC049]